MNKQSIPKERSQPPRRTTMDVVPQAAQSIEHGTNRAFSDERLAQRSSGRPIEQDIRALLEPQFSYNFGNVRIHTDDVSDRMAQNIHAVAFTDGHDIFFRHGAYKPVSPVGMHLLAHELTHVIQQESKPGNGLQNGRRKILGSPTDCFEQAAERTARSVLSGNQVAVPSITRNAVGIQRMPLTCETSETHEESLLEELYLSEPSSSENGATYCADDPTAATENTANFGKLSTMAQVFHNLGTSLDALAPEADTSATLTANAEIVVEGVYASIGFLCNVARSAAGLSGTFSINAKFGVGEIAGAGPASEKAYAALTIAKSLTVKGDDGGECADLVGLWTVNYLTTQPEGMWALAVEAYTNPGMLAARSIGLSQLAANTLWGEDFPNIVLGSMDPMSTGAAADTVTETLTGGADASVSGPAVTGDGNPSGQIGASAQAVISGVTMIAKDDAGKMTITKPMTGGITVGFSGFGLKGTFAFDYATGIKVTVSIPCPKAMSTPAWEFMAISFRDLIKGGMDQLKGALGGNVSNFNKKNDILLGAISTWQTPLATALVANGIADATIEGVVTVGPGNAGMLIFSNVTTAALPPGTLGAVAAGVSVTGSAATKTAFLSLPF